MGGRSCSLAFLLVHKDVPTVVLAYLSTPSPQTHGPAKHLGVLVLICLLKGLCSSGLRCFSPPIPLCYFLHTSVIYEGQSAFGLSAQSSSFTTFTVHVSSLYACICTQSLFVTHGLQPTRLLSSWDSPGKNTRMGCHFFLQGIFQTQGSNPCLLHLLHCRQILCQRSHQGSRFPLY